MYSENQIEICNRISIFRVCEYLGIRLKKGKGRSSFYSPFRDEKNPSFSISSDGRFWKDFTTDEGGNVISFLSKYEGCSNGHATSILEEMLELENPKKVIRDMASAKFLPKQEHLFSKPTASGVQVVIDLHWEEEQADYLCGNRNFERMALKYLFNNGCFGFCRIRNRRCWVITDEAHRLVEARRTYAEKEIWVISGSDKHHVIGSYQIGNRKRVCICEGSTDFIALTQLLLKFRLIDTIAPVAMLGCMNISADCISPFEGKDVLILNDQDEAGQLAADRWKKTLSPIVSSVKKWNPAELGLSGKDLCDYLPQLNANDNITKMKKIIEGSGNE